MVFRHLQFSRYVAPRTYAALAFCKIRINWYGYCIFLCFRFHHVINYTTMKCREMENLEMQQVFTVKDRNFKGDFSFVFDEKSSVIGRESVFIRSPGNYEFCSVRHSRSFYNYPVFTTGKWNNKLMNQDTHDSRNF